MQPKLIVALILYMVVVYSTVYVFTTDSFAIDTSFLPDEVSADNIDDLNNTDYSSEYSEAQNMSWLDSIGTFFGTIVKAFSVLVGLLTFNILSPYSLGIFTIIPFLMVLPVWIAIIYWLAPYVVKAISAIGNWIPFT